MFEEYGVMIDIFFKRVIVWVSGGWVKFLYLIFVVDVFFMVWGMVVNVWMDKFLCCKYKFSMYFVMEIEWGCIFCFIIYVRLFNVILWLVFIVFVYFISFLWGIVIFLFKKSKMFFFVFLVLMVFLILMLRVFL